MIDRLLTRWRGFGRATVVPRTWGRRTPRRARSTYAAPPSDHPLTRGFPIQGTTWAVVTLSHEHIS